MLGRGRAGRVREGGGQDSQTAVVRGPFLPFRKFFVCILLSGQTAKLA